MKPGGESGDPSPMYAKVEKDCLLPSVRRSQLMCKNRREGSTETMTLHPSSSHSQLVANNLIYTFIHIGKEQKPEGRVFMSKDSLAKQHAPYRTSDFLARRMQSQVARPNLTTTLAEVSSPHRTSNWGPEM